MITGFWHAGLTVSSMERSLAFYRDLLGLEIVSDRTVREAGVLAVTGTAVGAIRVCMLRVPGADAYLELLQYDALRPAGAAARPDSVGTAHVCFYVDDLPVAWERLRAAGVVAISGAPVDFSDRIPGTWCVYVHDPDGFVVELFDGPHYPDRTPRAVA